MKIMIAAAGATTVLQVTYFHLDTTTPTPSSETSTTALNLVTTTSESPDSTTTVQDLVTTSLGISDSTVSTTNKFVGCADGWVDASDFGMGKI